MQKGRNDIRVETESISAPRPFARLTAHELTAEETARYADSGGLFITVFFSERGDPPDE